MSLDSDYSNRLCVFLVQRAAVYLHETAGIFTSFSKAQAAADALQRQEPDTHHHYEVRAFALDVPGRVASRGEPQDAYPGDCGINDGPVVYSTAGDRHCYRCNPD